MSGHECKLLCEAQSAIEYVNARGMPPRKSLKNRSFDIEFEGISGS